MDLSRAYMPKLITFSKKKLNFEDFCQGGDHGKICCERMFFEETVYLRPGEIVTAKKVIP